MISWKAETNFIRKQKCLDDAERKLIKKLFCHVGFSKLT